MAEWVMFDAVFSNVGSTEVAIFFSVSALDVNLLRGIYVSNADLI